VAISAGTNSSGNSFAIALKNDGTVVGWGTHGTGGTTVRQTGISAGGWTADSTIRSVATQLEGALATLRNESSKLSANLSVVTTRQTFTGNMAGTLQTGADNLTLADTNQEGANLLMLQTRQSLGITSLSLASQAAQAVLKLF
jgi:flagellin-like hook-associated protein FlgL